MGSICCTAVEQTRHKPNVPARRYVVYLLFLFLISWGSGSSTALDCVHCDQQAVGLNPGRSVFPSLFLNYLNFLIKTLHRLSIKHTY